MTVEDRMLKIVERTNALQPVKVSVESILAGMEEKLDEREAQRAKRAEMDAKEEAKFAAEREAQKAFQIGDAVIWNTYHSSYKGERLATSHQGEVVDFEDGTYFGPFLLVKQSGHSGVSKVRVLEHNAQKVTR